MKRRGNFSKLHQNHPADRSMYLSRQASEQGITASTSRAVPRFIKMLAGTARPTGFAQRILPPLPHIRIGTRTNVAPRRDHRLFPAITDQPAIRRFQSR